MLRGLGVGALGCADGESGMDTRIALRGFDEEKVLVFGRLLQEASFQEQGNRWLVVGRRAGLHPGNAAGARLLDQRLNDFHREAPAPLHQADGVTDLYITVRGRTEEADAAHEFLSEACVVHAPFRALGTVGCVGAEEVDGADVVVGTDGWPFANRTDVEENA